jgi:hypothetical protein
VLTQEIIEHMKEFCLNEDKMLWQMGDYLNEHKLTDEEIEKLADIVQRKASTLRQREMVAREFQPEVRNYNHAWSVYKELMRVKGKDSRQELLDGRNEWTVDSMKSAVNDFISSQPSDGSGRNRIGTPLGGASAGMRIGNILIRGTEQNGELTITIDKPLSDIQTLSGKQSTTIICHV